MTRDARKLLAQIKAYKLEGLSHRRVAKALGVTENVVAGLIHRDRHRKGIGPRPYTPRLTMAEKMARDFEAPAPRKNDCLKHLVSIQQAHGSGFPFLTIDYRRAA